jgi:hypothetical protein
MTIPQQRDRKSEGVEDSNSADEKDLTGDGQSPLGEGPGDEAAESTQSHVPEAHENAGEKTGQEDVADEESGHAPANEAHADSEEVRPSHAANDGSAPPIEPDVPKSNDAGEKTAAKSESKPSEPVARRPGGFDLEKTFGLVRLDQIDGLEEDTADFCRRHDLLAEVNLHLDRWSPQLLRWGVNCMHLTLWRRKGRLVVLGSGRVLTLARRIAKHDDRLPATVVESKTLTTQQKLLILCEEMLFRPAFYRPGPGHAAAALRLWQDLVAAGVQPAKGPELRQFALAMGLSPATVRQHMETAEKQAKLD